MLATVTARRSSSLLPRLLGLVLLTLLGLLVALGAQARPATGIPARAGWGAGPPPARPRVILP